MTYGAKGQGFAVLPVNVDVRNAVVVTRSNWRELLSSAILINQILSCVQLLLYILLVQCSNLFIDILNIVLLHYFLNLYLLVGMSVWTHVLALYTTRHS